MEWRQCTACNIYQVLPCLPSFLPTYLYLYVFAASKRIALLFRPTAPWQGPPVLRSRANKQSGTALYHIISYYIIFTTPTLPFLNKHPDSDVDTVLTGLGPTDTDTLRRSKKLSLNYLQSPAPDRSEPRER